MVTGFSRQCRLRRPVAWPDRPPAELGLPGPLPAGALVDPTRRKYFNRRRVADPFGSGCASTWRTQLIKVACEVQTRARRIIIRLAASWPYLKSFQNVSQAILSLPVAAVGGG